MVDLLSTGVAQLAIVGLSLVLVRIIAGRVTEEHLGVFMVSRRIVGVLVPLTTLNLGIGLARYLSFQPALRGLHASASLWIVFLLSGAANLVLTLGSGYFSVSFFGTDRYPGFVVLIGLTLLGANLVGLVSDIYRGRGEMSWSNGIQVLFFVVPIGLLPIAWRLGRGESGAFLAYHLGLTGLAGLLLALAFFGLGPAWEVPKGLRSLKAAEVRPLVAYSVSRMPSSFLIGLVFVWPVLVAGRSGSLELAARVGILATLVRLMETWSYPFNLIVLPRFAGMSGEKRAEEIQIYASLVLDFIVTAIPIIGALSFGMARGVVELSFGPAYVELAGLASWILLASTAYVAFVLIRGVLDGVHGFPWVNLISIVGLIATGVVLLGAGSHSLFQLAGALVAGLLGMGGGAVLLLMWTTGARVPFRGFIGGLLAGGGGFFLARAFDGAVSVIGLGTAATFLIETVFRIAVLSLVFLLFWRSGSLWGRAAWSRLWS